MRAFLEIAATIQVGTRRAPVNRSGYLGDYQPASPEKAALVEAGTLDLLQRAGTVGRRGVSPLPSAPEETRRVARASASPLREALRGQPVGVVLEWAEQARMRGAVAPAVVLPELVALAVKHPEILPVLGARGAWLAEAMGVALRGEDEAQPWLEDPDGYRAWLESEFDQLDWKERAEAVARLRPTLRAGDEPLLQRAVGDRRREVREAACSLLMLLSESRLRQEVLQVAGRVVRLEKSVLRKSLLLDPPEPGELPKGLPRSSARAGWGPKAVALYDVVRHVPPSLWTSATGLAAGELAALAVKTEYAEVVETGWTEAAQRFEDQAWTDALFMHLAARGQSAEPWLAARASQEVFERVAIEQLRAGRHALWMALQRKSLSASMSRAIVEAVEKAPSAHYDLHAMPLILHLSVLPLLQNPWGDGHPNERVREQWQGVLELRQRLLSSLEGI